MGAPARRLLRTFDVLTHQVTSAGRLPVPPTPGRLSSLYARHQDPSEDPTLQGLWLLERPPDMSNLAQSSA